MLNNIAFTSTIRPVTIHQYQYEVSHFENPKFVGFPWTLDEAKSGKNIYTTNVIDCTVCGIKVKDKVFLLHTSPLQIANKNFQKIEEVIEENVDLKADDIQAILIGGKPPYTHGPDSYNQFENYEKFLQKHNIPYTKLKGGMGSKHVAYSSKKDEWLIANSSMATMQERTRTTPMNELKKVFNEVSICSKDKVSWYA